MKKKTKSIEVETIRQKKFVVRLSKVVKLLDKKSKYMTVNDIAEKMECTYLSAVKYKTALEQHGCKFESLPIKREDGQNGRTPIGWRLVANQASKKIVDTAKNLP